MTCTLSAKSYPIRQRGMGMVETMIGILIGLIVIVVIFNILSVAEGYKRATIGASDAQITGLLSQFVAGRDAGNGGSGITMSAGSTSIPADLINCTKNEAGAAISGLAATALDAAVRPVPVLITNAGGAGLSDSFISYAAGAPHVTWPVDFVTPFPTAGTPITVQSPNGFSVPPPSGATPYWAVVMTNDGTGTCKVLRLIAATPPDAAGKVTLTQGTPATTISYTAGGPARLLNLGPQGSATRIQYDVDSVNAVLRTTDLLVAPPAIPTPVPFAQNIVFMKVQYGVDTNADQIIDCWTPADASTCGDFSPAAVRGFTFPQLNRILAVRIGVVVRSDEPDLRLLTNPGDVDLQAQSRALLNATRPQPYLFNCSANTNAACPNRVPVPMGGGGGAPTCAPAVICDYWRYRVYETVIPLRNAIYAATLPP
jgi:type IV pilus assembly protein PilW